MKINWNFLGEGRGEGAKQKTFHGGSMDIFWNCIIGLLAIDGVHVLLGTILYSE